MTGVTAPVRDPEAINAEPVRLLALFRLSGAKLDLFREYEASVLSLLPDHGGRLERRVRSVDSTLEAHLLSFADRAGFGSYRTDKRRSALAGLLERSGAETEVVEVVELETEVVR